MDVFRVDEGARATGVRELVNASWEKRARLVNARHNSRGLEDGFSSKKHAPAVVRLLSQRIRPQPRGRECRKEVAIERGTFTAALPRKPSRQPAAFVDFLIRRVLARLRANLAWPRGGNLLALRNRAAASAVVKRGLQIASDISRNTTYSPGKHFQT